MQIIVNEKIREFSVPLNITELLATINLPSVTGIAVAVNNQVIKRDEWERFHLSEGDRVLVIKATQGG